MALLRNPTRNMAPRCREGPGLYLTLLSVSLGVLGRPRRMKIQTHSNGQKSIPLPPLLHNRTLCSPEASPLTTRQVSRGGTVGGTGHPCPSSHDHPDAFPRRNSSIDVDTVPPMTQCFSRSPTPSPVAVGQTASPCSPQPDAVEGVGWFYRVA